MIATLLIDSEAVTLTVQGADPSVKPHDGDPFGAIGEFLGGSVRRVRVVLGWRFAQVRHLPDMPPVNAAQLAAIVARQPRRYFRGANDAVLVTAAVWHHDGAKRLAVLAAAAEPFLARLAEVVWSHRARLDHVTVRGLETTAIDLIPPGQEVVKRRGELRRLGALLALLAAIWIGSAAWKTVALSREVHRLERRLAAAAATVSSIRRARAEVEQVETALALVDSLRASRSGLVATLRVVADAIPLGASLTTVSLSHDSLLLAGSAPSPAAVVRALSARKELARVRLEAPRSRGPIGGSSPFEITTALVNPR